MLTDFPGCLHIKCLSRVLKDFDKNVGISADRYNQGKHLVSFKLNANSVSIKLYYEMCNTEFNQNWWLLQIVTNIHVYGFVTYFLARCPSKNYFNSIECCIHVLLICAQEAMVKASTLLRTASCINLFGGSETIESLLQVFIEEAPLWHSSDVIILSLIIQAV